MDMAEYRDSLVEPGWWDPKSGGHLPEDIAKKARAESLIGCARNLETIQSDVHQQNLMNAQLYSNRELSAFDWGNGALHRASLAPINRTGENLVLSVVDTLVAQVGKQRPKAKPQTRGASWRLRKQARLLDKFLYGEFRRNRVYTLGKRVFRDACIFGFGCLHFSLVDGRVSIERVFPDELLIDQMEVVACGKPRHIYRRRVLPVEVVAETYDITVEELERIAKTSDYLEYRAVGKGYVVVVQGWQLARGGDDGYYMAAVNGVVLEESAYKSEHPPFVFFHWQDQLDGFYRPGAVEQALPYQIRLNEINEVIRDAQDIMGRPRLLVAEGSRVNPMELDNLVAKVIKYTGIKPEAVTWGAVNAELYNERDRCWGQCRDQFGINAFAASSHSEGTRYDSSAALREANNIQDDRLADPAQRFEEFYLEVAETIIRTIDDGKAKPTTMWYSGGKHARCEKIDWKEIDIDRDSYVLTMEATSIANMGPAAIRDDLEKQLAMGIISPEQYRLELAHPDDSAELSLQAAAAADIRRVIELLEEGKWEDPTPVQDLVNGVQLVSLAALNLNQYEEDEEYEEGQITLEQIKLNFVDWITAARGWLDDGAEEETMGEPMQPGMAPPMDPATMGGMPMVPVPEAAGLATQPIPLNA